MSLTKILILFLNLLVASTAFCEEASDTATPPPQTVVTRKHKAPLRVEDFQMGHNVSATSDTLGQGQCVIGAQAVACGATDRLTMGISPWLIKDYKMANVGIRYFLFPETDGRWAIQADYFKTFYQRDVVNNPSHDYEMEAYWLMLVRTYQLEDHYKLHVNLHTNYYKDEKLPFSLRRPYISPRPYQVNITTLHQLEMTAGWMTFVEVGLLDLLNSPIHAHGGFSIGRKSGRLSYHVGVSLTGTYDGFFGSHQRADYQQTLRASQAAGYDSPLDPTMIKYDFAMHPEFSLQYLF